MDKILKRFREHLVMTKVEKKTGRLIIYLVSY